MDQFSKHVMAKLDSDTPIYRYINVNKLESIIQNGVISLSLIVSWPDIHEGLYFRYFSDKIAQKSDQNLPKLDCIFGSSWTLENLTSILYSNESKEFQIKALESIELNGTATMWDAYCPSGGARIKTTIGKLEQLLINNSELEFAHGCVGYSPEAYPVGLATGELLKNLFVKRISFFHENEYRFIGYFNIKTATDSHLSTAENEIRLKIEDLGYFFDEILIFPNKHENDAGSGSYKKAKKLHELCYPLIHKSQFAKGLNPTINNKNGKCFCRISQIYNHISANIG